MVSVALALPMPIAAVASGASKPNSVSALLSGALIAFICAVWRRVTSPSTAPKSVRAETGLARVHSSPVLANWMVRSRVVISMRSAFARSKVSTDLLRSMKVDLSNDVSRYAETRKTFFCPPSMAYMSPPVAVFSPNRTVRNSLSPSA
jgi:hypothetical protein